MSENITLRFNATGLAKIASEIETTVQKLGGLEKISREMSSVGTRLTIGVTLPIAGASAAALKLASDAVESKNLFKVALGEMSGEAERFSKAMGDALDLDPVTIEKTVGIFDQMLLSMGFTSKQAIVMAENLTRLRTDIASYYNLAPDVAFQKLQAGLVGMIRPLRDIGILVDQNTVKQVALEHGLIKSGQQMDQQTTVYARYLAMLAATTNAQGDFRRTMTQGLANPMRRLHDQVTQLGRDFGNVLLPSVSQATEKLIALTKAARELSPEIKGIITVFGLGVASIGPLIAGLANLSLAGIGLSRVWRALGATTQALFKGGGVFALAAGAIAAWVTLAVTEWNTFKLRTIEAWTELKDYLFGAVDDLLHAMQYLAQQGAKLPFIGKGFSGIAAGIGDARDALAALRDKALAGSADQIQKLQQAISDAGKPISDAGSAAAHAASGVNAFGDAMGTAAGQAQALKIAADGVIASTSEITNLFGDVGTLSPTSMMALAKAAALPTPPGLQGPYAGLGPMWSGPASSLGKPVNTLDLSGFAKMSQEAQHVVNDVIPHLVGGASKGFEDIAAVAISQMGVAVQAAYRGFGNIAEIVVSSVTSILQALSRQGGPLGGLFGGLFGPVVGAIGGILGAIVGGGQPQQPIPVHIADPVVKTEEQTPQGPSHVILQVISPTTGEMIDEIQYELDRRSRRDATIRIPAGTALGGP